MSTPTLRPVLSPGKLQASKLIYLSDVAGVLKEKDDPESLISSLTTAAVEALIAAGVVAGGMIPKVRSAVDALQAGVGKIHLIDGRIPPLAHPRGIY